MESNIRDYNLRLTRFLSARILQTVPGAVLQKSGEQQQTRAESKEQTEAKPLSNAKRKRGSDDESGRSQNQTPQMTAAYVPAGQVSSVQQYCQHELLSDPQVSSCDLLQL